VPLPYRQGVADDHLADEDVKGQVVHPGRQERPGAAATEQVHDAAERGEVGLVLCMRSRRHRRRHGVSALPRTILRARVARRVRGAVRLACRRDSGISLTSRKTYTTALTSAAAWTTVNVYVHVGAKASSSHAGSTARSTTVRRSTAVGVSIVCIARAHCAVRRAGVPALLVRVNSVCETLSSTTGGGAAAVDAMAGVTPRTAPDPARAAASKAEEIFQHPAAAQGVPLWGPRPEQLGRHAASKGRLTRRPRFNQRAALRHKRQTSTQKRRTRRCKPAASVQAQAERPVAAGVAGAVPEIFLERQKSGRIG